MAKCYNFPGLLVLIFEESQVTDFTSKLQVTTLLKSYYFFGVQGGTPEPLRWPFLHPGNPVGLLILLGLRDLLGLLVVLGLLDLLSLLIGVASLIS